jgi:hypothetical protein
VGFDYGLYYVWLFATRFASTQLDRTHKDWQTAMQQYPSLVNDVALLANEAGLADLAQQLTTHSSPLPSASRQSWQQYAQTLLTILRDERDLVHEWNFRQNDLDKLNSYFYANELLVQCLKVAVVSDRQAVLNGLLLPPQVES